MPTYTVRRAASWEHGRWVIVRNSGGPGAVTCQGFLTKRGAARRARHWKRLNQAAQTHYPI